MDFTVARTLNFLHIILDIIWLLIFAGILLYFKNRKAVIVGLFMGVVYFVVDYEFFYHLLGTRHVEGANTFWFLLWLSLSYGLTNFARIWLLLDHDGHAVDWSLLPILGWIAAGQLSTNFGPGLTTISISRGIGSYHGAMALILLAGYLIVIIRNLSGKEDANTLWRMAIGIGVQFAWEASLLINGIRPAVRQPIVINSLIEKNLGIPYTYLHSQICQQCNFRNQKSLP